jgi:hypothetical protein
MGAKTTALSSAILALLLNATTYANVAQNASVAPLTSLYLSLHTASPGASGSQTTSEATYTGYARQAINRNSSGFTVATGSATLTSSVSFPVCTAVSETETYFGLGESLSGAGALWYFGPISPTIAVSPGVTPQLTTGTTISES